MERAQPGPAFSLLHTQGTGLGEIAKHRLLPSMRLPSFAAAASAGLLLHPKPLAPYISAEIPLDQFLGSLEERSLEAADRRRGWCPKQLTIQGAALFQPYVADVDNFPLSVPAVT